MAGDPGIWAIIVGYAAFSEIPDTWRLAGSVLVAGCGLYILQYGRRPKAVAPGEVPS